jgi:hypothetical protein
MQGCWPALLARKGLLASFQRAAGSGQRAANTLSSISRIFSKILYLYVSY